MRCHPLGRNRNPLGFMEWGGGVSFGSWSRQSRRGNAHSSSTWMLPRALRRAHRVLSPATCHPSAWMAGPRLRPAPSIPGRIATHRCGRRLVWFEPSLNQLGRHTARGKSATHTGATRSQSGISRGPSRANIVGTIPKHDQRASLIKKRNGPRSLVERNDRGPKLTNGKYIIMATATAVPKRVKPQKQQQVDPSQLEPTKRRVMVLA